MILARRGWHRSALMFLALMGVTALFVLPLVWLVSGSLRQPGLPPPREMEWLPSPLVWENYTRIFELLPLGRYLLNSLIVTAIAAPLTLVTASWAGLGMALLHKRARRRLLLVSVGLLIIPAAAFWLGRFVLFARLGLTNSFAALIAPALMGSNPLFVLLYYWNFRRLPVEIFESARLDGAGSLAVWRRIAFPLARSTSLAVGMLAVMAYWNDFINPLLYLKSQRLYTLAVGVQQLQQLDKTNWPLLLAASVTMALPVVGLFFLLQRYFLKENPLSGVMGR